MIYDKQCQLKKTKKDNPKKMSKKEYRAKCDWLFETYPVCQICLAHKAQDVHHSKFGRDRDDRSIISICRACHYEIHHGKGVALHRADIEVIGEQNHKEYENVIKHTRNC